MTHHQRIGLSHKIGFHTGGQSDGSNQGTAGRYDPPFCGTGQIGVCSDELGTVLHQLDGMLDLFIADGTGFSENNIVRVVVVHGKTGFVQSIHQPRLPDDIGTAAGALGRQK